VSSRSKKPVIQARLLGFSSSQDTKTRRRPTRRPARIILVRFRGCRPASIQLRLGLLDHPAQSPYELGQLIAQDSVAFPRQPNQPTTVVERPKELNIANFLDDRILTLDAPGRAVLVETEVIRIKFFDFHEQETNVLSLFESLDDASHFLS